MAAIVSRRATFICKACRSGQLNARASRSVSSLIQTQTWARPQRRTRAGTSNGFSRLRPQYAPYRAVSTANAASTDFKTRITRNKPTPQTSPQNELTALRLAAAEITGREQLPSSEEVINLLERMHEFARYLIYTEDASSTEAVVETQVQEESRTPAEIARGTSSALLDDLDDNGNSNGSIKRKAKVQAAPQQPSPDFSPTFREEASASLADTLYNLVRDPKINITQPILRWYTLTQCLLAKPEYIPEIFEQFAYKPIAHQRSPARPITYAPTRLTWRRQYAIPFDLSTIALSTAIHKRDMALAVAITDTSVHMPAHRFLRFCAKGLPRLAVASLFPALTIILANWVSTYQNTFEPYQARDMAIAAGMAYFATFGSVAFVTAATWNDHHVRVHWEKGALRLRDRWLREDERAFLDRIAQAWGFEDRDRRGEEVGDEWEALRDTIGMRGMILDKTEFMKGF